MISNPELTIACCESGVIGTFPALNQRDSEGYEGWLETIERRLGSNSLAAPFGVNLSLRRNNARLERDLEITVAHRVPLVLTSLGISDEIVERIHAYGGIVLHDVISQRHARRAVAAGVDGLILVCAGAGGHAGRLNPFAFLAETRSWFDGTIALAGGITSGRQVAAARLAGADLAALGTRFIMTRESGAPDGYKAMIAEASTADLVYTPHLTGVGATFLAASLNAWGIESEAASDAIDKETRTVRHQGREGKVCRDIWSAGQAAGAICDIPTAAELCRRLADDCAEARHAC
jgi:nitronate monooxygenase